MSLTKKEKKEFITLNGAEEKDLEKLPFKQYQIKGTDNELYNLKIYKSDKFILFIIKDISDFRAIKYKNKLILEEFYNLNRFFRQYLSLEELFTLLFKNLKNSEINIYKKDNNIKLSFIVDCRGKEEEIPFILKPEQSNIKNIVENISEKVKEIENENESNKNILKELKKLKNNINKDNLDIINNNERPLPSFILIILHYLKLNKTLLIIFLLSIIIELVFIKNLKNDISDLTKEIQKIEDKNIKSLIIKNDELYLIEDEIQKIYNKNISKYELLFRASKDGFRAIDFHNKCDGINNTITLVKTTNGKRFGGFNDLSWNSNNNIKAINFIFDLKEKEVFYNDNNNNNNNNKIDSYSNYGPIFEGNNGFKISDNCNENKNYFNSIQSKNSYPNNRRHKKNNNNINNFFYIKDYEVYKLYFE